MTRSYAQHYNTRKTPQSEAIPGSTQVENSAGGYAYAVDNWTRLDRFLILGSEGGSYYANEHTLTVENAEAVKRCIDADGKRTVDRIVEISTGGRAPKNDPAIFALAMCAGMGNANTKSLALNELRAVARIPTHLFAFVEAVQGFCGWGRALRRAVGQWYASPIEKLAYQMVKYRQRNGWTHRDVLRLSHPKANGDTYNALFKWAVSGDMHPALPPIVHSYDELQRAQSKSDVLKVLRSDHGTTWEMIPTEYLSESEVWHALLPNMPMMALIRNLGRMTANGLLKPMNHASRVVCDKLSDKDAIERSRIHPIAALGALLTYRSGHGARGKLSWEPVKEIGNALEDVFYAAFDNVEPTGKRWVLALDVSGSMGFSGDVGGMVGLTPRMAAAAMAMVTARTEQLTAIMAFSGGFIPLDITERDSLSDAVRKTDGLPFDSTDCSLPMRWALANRIEADVFVVYTDSETWSGTIHPTQALNEYRQKMGIPAKLIVCGMVSNGFSIADPNDGGMMDVVGFDTATPNIMADFVRH